MKTKIQLLFVALLMGVTVSVSAQSQVPAQQKTITPEQIAQKETERMTQNLSLTSDQQAKVQAINLKYAQQRSKVMAAHPRTGTPLTEQERAQLKADAQKSIASQQAELQSVLTADQYQKLVNNAEAARQKIAPGASKVGLK